MNRNSLTWLAAAVIAGLGIFYVIQRDSSFQKPAVEVKVPELTSEARAGQVTFEANCMKCHGRNAGGTDQGPPLIHKIYEPGHHADISFYRAVQFGVKAHHWPFGNMPPVAGVTEEDVSSIVHYVRELQRANGIN